MHDNLRLQRLVQQLANKVRKLADKQGATDTEPHESHQQFMALAEATFREMSLQVNTAMSDQMQRHGIGLQLLWHTFAVAALVLSKPSMQLCCCLSRCWPHSRKVMCRPDGTVSTLDQFWLINNTACNL